MWWLWLRPLPISLPCLSLLRTHVRSASIDQTGGYVYTKNLMRVSNMRGT